VDERNHRIKEDNLDEQAVVKLNLEILRMIDNATKQIDWDKFLSYGK
jgi:hypothetical protein